MQAWLENERHVLRISAASILRLDWLQRMTAAAFWPAIRFGMMAIICAGPCLGLICGLTSSAELSFGHSCELEFLTGGRDWPASVEGLLGQKANLI